MFEDINWIDGMLLSAMHLKNIKQINFYKLFYLLKNRYKYFYGVINLEYDISYLSNGRLIINKLFALLQDGSVVEFDMCNTSNESLYIDLNTKNIENNQEFIIYLSIINNNSLQQDLRFYNVNNVKYDDENKHVLSQYINYIKIKPYLSLKEEINANMITLPLFKIYKHNNTYSLQDFIYMHLCVNQYSNFGKQVIALINNLLSKTSVVYTKIKEFNKEKYLDYDLFCLIRSYDVIVYSLYDIKQDILNNGLGMYELYSKLTNVLRKSLSVNSQNILESQEFNVENLTDSFNYIMDNIEVVINTIFYSDIETINFKKYKNNELHAEYKEFYSINNKIYIQCVYSSRFIENKSYIYEIIQNMSIASSSCINYIHSTRVTGLDRRIINDFMEIKRIIGIVNIENAVIIEVLLDKIFFKSNEDLVIILPEEAILKFNFNIIYSNSIKN